MKNAIFIIEGDKPLEMVKAYIADRTRICLENNELAKQLGVEQIYTCRRTGRLTGVVFAGQPHADFCKPKKRNGVSYPKKGTEWAKRLAGLQGTKDAAPWIAKEFGIPLSVSYTSSSGGQGWRHMGNPLHECGFMWFGADGPYAMWTANVPAIVKSMAERGDIVDEPKASFKFDVPGARQILQEEWELMVAQHNLARKKAEAA